MSKINNVKSLLSVLNVNDEKNIGALDNALDVLTYLVNVSDTDEQIKAAARSVIESNDLKYDQVNVQRDALAIITCDFLASVKTSALTENSRGKVRNLLKILTQTLAVKRSMNESLASKKAARFVTFYSSDGKAENVAHTVLSASHINLKTFFTQKCEEAQDLKAQIAAKCRTDSHLAMQTLRKSNAHNVKIVLVSQFFRCWLTWLSTGDIHPLLGLLHDVETLKNHEADSVFLALVHLGFVGHSIVENRQNIGIGGKGYGFVCDRPPVLDDCGAGWMERHALKGFLKFAAQYAEVSEIQLIAEGQHKGNLRGFTRVIHSAFWVDFVAVVLQTEKELIAAQDSRKKSLAELATQAKRLINAEVISLSGESEKEDLLKLKADFAQKEAELKLAYDKEKAESKRLSSENKALSSLIKSLRETYAKGDLISLGEEVNSLLSELDNKAKAAKSAKAKA